MPELKVPERDDAPALPGSRRSGLMAAGVAGLAALLLAIVVLGAARPDALADPGTLVRWGLPLVVLLHDAAVALTLGAALLGAGVVDLHGQAGARLRRISLWSAGVWVAAAMLRVFLDFCSVAGVSPLSPGLGQQVWSYASQVQRGQLLAGVLFAAMLTCTVLVAAAGPLGYALAAFGVTAGLLCLSFTGHSAQAGGHELAVSSLWLHLLGVGAWAGGLVVMILLAGALERPRTVLARYSASAGLAYFLVLVSGVGNAVLRVGNLSGLTTRYGLIVVAKAALLGLLGIAGWRQRSRMLAQGSDFRRLAVIEVGLLAAATGLGVALSVSAPPGEQTTMTDPTPAELVTGEPLPPPLTVARLFTQWTPDLLWAVIALVLAWWYLRGVRRLRSEDIAWPVNRTICWLLGCLALLYTTCGGLARYGRVMFSAHMVDHMALTMVVPMLLVFGAPITLLLRAVPARRDGSRGPREWVRVMLGSWWLRLLSNPLVAAVNFAGSIIIFYFSPLFSLALRTHLGHELMMLHFLLAGYLFANTLVGIDPTPGRWPYPLRLMLLLGTMVFHAFFGVALMGGTALLAATYFSELGTGLDLLGDQQLGGNWAWGIGEIPTLALTVVLALQWSRSDSRESARRDRAADRDGDAELTAYNERLSQLPRN